MLHVACTFSTHKLRGQLNRTVRVSQSLQSYIFALCKDTTFKLAHFTKVKGDFQEVSIDLITWRASKIPRRIYSPLHSCLDLASKGTRVLLCNSQFNSSGKSPSHHRISVISSAPKYQPPAGRLKGEGATPWRPGK